MSVETTEELWGGETRKAVANFPVSGERIPVAVVRWLGRIKGAAARANADLGLLDADLAQRIAAAADEIAQGRHDDQFPIDVFQTGSGTSSNMNANEVIATLAGEGVHANDIALLGSGPRAGIGEIFLPELQKGSSIMPGKVNPVLPEVVLQVSAQVIGNDTAITVGGMQGQFELNVRIPLIARNLLQSIHLLSTTSTLFAEKCVEGIQANLEGCERSAESTLAVATALNPYIGYDKAADIVKEAAASGRTLREVAREHGVDEATLDEALDLRKIAAGSSSS